MSPSNVKFDIHGSFVEGELVKWNNKTCVVKYKEPEDKGGKIKVLKRHVMKHHVVESAVTPMEKLTECKCSSECKCSVEAE